ncbi:MAG: hypothetical protein EAX81_05935 [Candidatus Thorarchaeota archaeon]|nr:hypothetical protein [Candidatus Thorarchaeota archaeon]
MTQWAVGQLSKKELVELRRLRIVKEALDEFKRRGIDADIVVCPVCKSHRVIDLTSYHDLGFLGSFQPAYYCLDCGWYGRIAPMMTNRPDANDVLQDMKEAFPSYRDEIVDAFGDIPADER